MYVAVTPGRDLTVDELVSQWHGIEAEFLANGVPHLTKVVSRPQGVGVTAKATADGATRVVPFTETVERKEDMALKKYCLRKGAAANDEEYMRTLPKVSHTAATTLRLVESWHGTWRVVVGDSWLGSLSTAVELRSKGLHCTLTVKTGHKGFPKKELSQWSVGPGRRVGKRAKRSENPPRGSFRLYQLNVRNHARNESYSIVALGWADKTVKTVISTRGHTSGGTPARRVRHRLESNAETGLVEQTRVTYETPRNYMIATFFDAFPAVDISDHYRQGILALESNWQTKRYHTRVFATVLGIVFTNAFLGYKYERGANDSSDFRTFLGKLAHALINNVYLDETHNTRTAAPNQVYFYHTFL